MTTKIEKRFVRPEELVQDAFLLARQIHRSGFRPDAILVLWRGGTPVGIVVHEYLLYRGIETYHTALKAVSYTGIGSRVEPVIEHLDSVIGKLPPGSRVLVVDDIFDSGRTMEAVSNCLKPRVQEVRLATLYYKEGANETRIEPDFYLRKTTDWIVFPHELVGLSREEIRIKDPFLDKLLAEDT